jgi:hypothetical protein
MSIRTGLVAAALSGAPSTLVTLARGEDVLASTRAVGAALLPSARRGPLPLLAGAVAHVTISVGWAVVLGRLLPGRRPLAEGVVAGLGIAALDLGVLGRRIPEVRALPQGRQWADHLAYGVTVSLATWRGGCPRRRR